MRGTETSTVRWDDAVLTKLVTAAGLRYLAVAHFGRGRGDFVAGEHPGHWRAAVEAAVGSQAAALAQVWFAAAGGEATAGLAQRLRPIIGSVLREVLTRCTGPVQPRTSVAKWDDPCSPPLRHTIGGWRPDQRKMPCR
jgi:hypothetical protein